MSEPTPFVGHWISAGIGRETARGMAERGYSVVVIGRDSLHRSRGHMFRTCQSGASPMFQDFSSLSEVRWP